jgi:hypothetical protein
MRTHLDLERLGTDKWRLRVRRSDDKGNVAATAAVDGDPTSVRVIAREAIKSWVLFDELLAQTQKALGERQGGR